MSVLERDAETQGSCVTVIIFCNLKASSNLIEQGYDLQSIEALLRKGEGRGGGGLGVGDKFVPSLNFKYGHFTF